MRDDFAFWHGSGELREDPQKKIVLLIGPRRRGQLGRLPRVGGHWLMEEAPAATIAAVQDFLSAH
ncbi:MAG TPA: hypothetical protein VHS33_06720 [Sphingomicrobium sp.]|nr:hypothetical protein [Sphingomicrobium sp.]